VSSDTGGTWRFGWLEPAGEYILAFIFSRAAAVSAQPVQVTSSAASSSADHSTHVCVYVAMGMHRKLAHARPEADSERVSALAGFSIALSGGNDEESEEARPLFEELVAITRREYGDRHPGTLSALHNFGLHLFGRGNTEGAVPLLKEALSGMQRLGAGGSDEVTLRCKSDLAAAYARSMEFAAARQLFEEATVEARRTRPTCEATFVAMGNFGDAIFNIGDHATALLLREEASASACRVLGAAHTTAKVLTRLANDTQQNVIGRASSKDTRAVGTLVGLTYASTLRHHERPLPCTERGPRRSMAVTSGENQPDKHHLETRHSGDCGGAADGAGVEWEARAGGELQRAERTVHTASRGAKTTRVECEAGALPT